MSRSYYMPPSYLFDQYFPSPDKVTVTSVLESEFWQLVKQNYRDMADKYIDKVIVSTTEKGNNDVSVVFSKHRDVFINSLLQQEK